MSDDRAARTRAHWLDTLARHKRDPDRPGSADYWSPSLDCAGRDELRAIQDAKLAALTPFLYENSGFYRRRFDRLGLLPTDLRTVDDLPKWPVVDKTEMMEDLKAAPPFGTYTTHDDALWAARGWMMFSSSGSTGVPRVFRYSQIDRELWEWANARALHAFGIRPGDTVLICAGYGPHVFAWGVQFALARMGVACIPGGGMTAEARAMLIDRFEPTVLTCTPSYALHLGRVMAERGLDPAASSIRTILVGGEPAAGIEGTRRRLEDLWSARLVEIWELVDAESGRPVAEGARGLTVCTSLNSESSPQLRFLVGDYTVLTSERCACGRTHVRAVGAFAGRVDELINLRGVKMYPVQLEAAVRAVSGVGDEYEIVLATTPDGLDVMTARVEHPSASIGAQVAREIQARCEVRCDVEVLAPGTLPKTEFKARRIRDTRR